MLLQKGGRPAGSLPDGNPRTVPLLGVTRPFWSGALVRRGPANDEPLHPVAGAGRFDVQVESVAVAVSARLGDAAAEGSRERLVWMGRLGSVFRRLSTGGCT